MSELRTITLNNTPLFSDLGKSKEKRLPDGTVITAIVENSRIVGYTARDATGKPREFSILTVSSGGPPGTDPILRGKCYFCFCDDTHCQCDETACPDPA